MWGPSLRHLLFLLFVPQCYGDATADLSSLMSEFWEWRLAESPLFATSVGENKYNDKITSYNITVFARRKNDIQAMLDRLNEIDSKSLSAADQVNYEIFHDGLVTYTDGYKWFHYGGLNPVNFLEGFQTDPSGFIRSIPFKSIDDFENYLKRLEQIKTQVEEIMELFREAIKLNRTLHKVSVSRIPGQIEKFLVDDVTQFSLYGPFNGTLDNLTISAEEKDILRGQAVTTLTNNVIGPYRAFKTFIEDEYIPATRTLFGVSSWPNGQDYYKACLKWHLSVDTTADEIHKMGTQEVERISAQMLKVFRGLGYTGTISESFTAIKKNESFKLETGEQILERYLHIVNDRIDPKLTGFFKDIPDLPLEVRPMPNDGPGGAYSSGSADGSRPGIFWVNVMRPHDTNTFDMMALTIHEANPGHHLQISTSLTLSLPNFRKFSPYSLSSVPYAFPGYTAYIEGWALYAEMLGEEMELYADEYELLGRYAGEIYRACRLVVDTGLHSMGWSRERAIEYMLNYTSSDRPDIEVEIDRYITWPGQACAYKYGEIKMKALRKKAEQELGEFFDLKEFHSTVLGLSSVPLHTLENAVDAMIAAVKARHERNASYDLHASVVTTVISFLVLLMAQR